MTIILGLDTGLLNTGWGVINASNNLLKYIACGTISTTSGKEISEKLYILHQELVKIIEIYQPDDIAIEDTFVNKNALSSLKLGQAKGALMVTAAILKKNIYSYAATQVKKSIVGVGRAEKEQVIQMVKFLLPQAEIKRHDSADALAIAICHHHHKQTNSLWGIK